MIPSILASNVTFNLWQNTWNHLSGVSFLGLIFALLLGAALGSFANVVIWRLPRRESLIKPASHCPHCGKPIPPKYNIPIISYLILRGCSNCCNQPLSIRYPFIETISMLTFASLYLIDCLTFSFLFSALWMLLLIILAAIDFEHYRLPNVLVVCGAILSLLWMLVSPEQTWIASLFGLLIAAGLAGLAIVLGKLMRGKWSGMGDLKLAAILGFTFGPGRFLILYIVASIAALFYAAFQFSRTGERKVAMGPFFALGAWVTFLTGETLVRWYIGFFP